MENCCNDLRDNYYFSLQSSTVDIEWNHNRKKRSCSHPFLVSRCFLKLLLLFFEIIIKFHHFPFPFHYPNPPTCPSSLSFKVIASLFRNYCYKYIVYTRTFLVHKYSRLNLYNITCVYLFADWPFGIGQWIAVLFPGWDYFSHSQHTLDTRSSLFMLENSCSC